MEPTVVHIVELQRRIAVYEDEAAYKELFLSMFDSLSRFSLGIVQSRETAEEIVSDVFIALWDDRLRLQEIEDLKAYLFVSVRNNSVRRRQQDRRAPRISIDDIDVQLESLNPDPEERLVSAETVRLIEEAVAGLPQRARLILKLAKEDRLRYKQISSLLGISVKTIDHQLAITLRKLSAKLRQSVRSRGK